MNTQKIIELRDHWHYTAIGESHRESADIARDTAVALNGVFKIKHQANDLRYALSNMISEVEGMLASGILTSECYLTKNLGNFKAALREQELI
jgi:hypothetical protein